MKRDISTFLLVHLLIHKLHTDPCAKLWKARTTVDCQCCRFCDYHSHVLLLHHDWDSHGNLRQMWFSRVCSVKAHETDEPAGVLWCGRVYCGRCTMFGIHQSIREFEQAYALVLSAISFYVELTLYFMWMQYGCGWRLSFFLRHCHHLWWHSMVVTFWRTLRSGWPGAVRMEANAETLT